MRRFFEFWKVDCKRKHRKIFVVEVDIHIVPIGKEENFSEQIIFLFSNAHVVVNVVDVVFRSSSWNEN